MAVDVIDIVASKLHHTLLYIAFILSKLFGQGSLDKALDATAHHLTILGIGMLRQVARAHNIVYGICQVTNGI